jgi:P27 family predicted phage terminase small subunit
MTPQKTKPVEPPKHLGKRSKTFWRQLNEQFVFEPHDLERLRIVCESLDQIDAAQVSISRDGVVVQDRYGCPKANPAVAVARDARGVVLRGLRELCVDVDVPEESRLPRQGRRYS